MSIDVQREARDAQRRADREVVGCGGALTLLFLVSLAIVFVGCPGAVSYGISRGCAAGAEHTR